MEVAVLKRLQGMLPTSAGADATKYFHFLRVVVMGVCSLVRKRQVVVRIQTHASAFLSVNPTHHYSLQSHGVYSGLV